MNRAKLLQLAASLATTRQLGNHSSGLTQVTRFSQLTAATQPSPFSSTINPHVVGFKQFNLYSRSFSTWNSKDFNEFLSSHDWSEELEDEFERLFPKLSHEFVVNLIWKSDWSKEVEVEVEVEAKAKAKAKAKLKNKITYPLSENYVLRVLWEVRKRMCERGSKGVYEHDSIIVKYSSILGIMTSRLSMLEFWEVLSRMKAEGLSYDKDFKSVVKIFRHILFSEDVALFEEMMDGPSKPSLDECNSLLGKISRFPDADLAYRVMNKCVAKGYTLSKEFYENMRRILFNVGKFDEAKKIVEEMRNAGYTLSKGYYDDMRRIFRKDGKFDEAKKIVEEMRNAGYEPDNSTYSLEVYDLCVEKRLKEARDMLDHMEEEGCVPDIKTWTILIRGCCAADQMDEALTYFSEMIGKNINPDAKTFEVMLYGCFLNKNKLLGAYKFLLEMVYKFNEKPSHETCKLMIEKLAEVEKFEEALEVLSMTRFPCYPPFYDPIIQCISKSGTVDDAKKVVKFLSSKGTPTVLSYIRVVKSFIEEGREAEAEDLICGSPAEYNRDIRYLFRSNKRGSNKRA